LPDLKTKSAWRRVLHWALALVALAWVAVLIAWGALHIFIVPRIGDYREALQQQASRAMGVRIDIGSIRMQGGWWVPWFEVKDLVLFDREGREALRLPHVLAAVSPRSVVLGQFEQLDVEQPELAIRRDVDGHVWVAGLDTSAAGDGRGADWFFSQPEFVVRQGVVHWRDESRPSAAQAAASVLTLQGVDVSVKTMRSSTTCASMSPRPMCWVSACLCVASFTSCLGNARETPRNGRANCLPTCPMWIWRLCVNG